MAQPSRHPFRNLTIANAVVGLVLISLPSLAELSYDVPYLFRWVFSAPTKMNQVVVVYANNDSVQKYPIAPGSSGIHRTNHAALIDLLKRENAKLTFYDFAFMATNSNRAVDEALARSIRENGSVVLVAGGETAKESGAETDRLVLAPLFRTNAAAWGHAQFELDGARKIPLDFAGKEYAGWLAVEKVAPEIVRSQDRKAERWMNYYGEAPCSAVPCYSFHEALGGNLPRGAFSDKFVFVGQIAGSLELGALKDTLRTPWSRFGGGEMPGVLVHATAFSNLIGNDWIRRVPWSTQCLLVGAWAALSSFLLFQVSRKNHWVAVGTACCACAVLSAASIAMQWGMHLWWAWIGPAVGQTLVALAWTAVHPKPNRYLAFISYRTAKDLETALLLQMELGARGCAVFLDKEQLRAGLFADHLRRAIRESDFLVVIVTRESLLRFAETGDWVCAEVRYAMDQGKTIIPVYKDGVLFEPARDLPECSEIIHLRGCEAVEYAPDKLAFCVSKLLHRMGRT